MILGVWSIAHIARSGLTLRVQYAIIIHSGVLMSQYLLLRLSGVYDVPFGLGFRAMARA